MSRRFEKPFAVRSKAYKAWIHKFPCVICEASEVELKRSAHWFGLFLGIGEWSGILPPVEAAHIGDHGLGTKTDDIRILPLCRYHHQADGHGLGKIGIPAFEKRHNIDLREVCLGFIARFIFEGGKF